MRTREKIAEQELEFLENQLRGKLGYERGVPTLHTDATIGSGMVKAVCIDEGLVALEFDILFREDHILCLNQEQENMIYFLYCLEGNCWHKFKDSENTTNLGKLQTVVIGNDEHSSSNLLIKKNERLILNLIRFDKGVYIDKFRRNEASDTEEFSLFDRFDQNKGHCHLGRINLQIAELIKMLEHDDYVDDFISQMHFEGVCHLILAAQITQFKLEMERDQTQETTLLKRELNQISQINDFIKSHPEIQHSITSLCSKSTLSAAKLQKGFRFLYQMTVGEFIRDTRLNKAVELLRTTEMNISEVVYSIGFTSRSYFCKIFKAKYGCNPKQYKQNLSRVLQKDI